MDLIVGKMRESREIRAKDGEHVTSFHRVTIYNLIGTAIEILDPTSR